MEKAADGPTITIKLQYLMVKWERVITAIVVLCAILAILSGVAWMVIRKNSLLVILLSLSSCYLIGKNFWKFRDKGLPLED